MRCFLFRQWGNIAEIRFLYCYTFEGDCLTGNDTCLSDGRKM